MKFQFGAKMLHGSLRLVDARRPRRCAPALRGVRVAAGGCARAEEAEIARCVAEMGGEFVAAAQGADVFVTECPMLPQCVLDAVGRVRVLRKEWVRDCFAAHTLLPFDEYALPRFSGMRVSTSDVEPRRAAELRETVEKGGGELRAGMDDKVTLLLAERLSMTPKIRLAVSSYVPVVRPEWVDEQRSGFADISQYVLNFWCVRDLKSYLFDGVAFDVSGECSERELLVEAIEANSGEVRPGAEISVVPNFCGAGKSCVTPVWVWNCISEQRIIPESESVIYRPFPFAAADNEFKGFVVVLYNLNEKVKFELAEGLRILGCCVHLKISKTSKVVVAECMDDYLKKQMSAYHIPVVSVNWVYDAFESNGIPDYSSYLLIREEKIKSHRLIDVEKKLIDIEKNGNFLSAKEKKNNDLPNFLSIDDLTNFSQDEKDGQHSSPLNITYETNRNVNNIELTEKFDQDPLLEVLSNF